MEQKQNREKQTKMTKTTITATNLDNETLAKIQAILDAANVETTVVVAEIKTENLLGFLGLSIDSEKVSQESGELFSKEGFAKAREATALRNKANANKLASIL